MAVRTLGIIAGCVVLAFATGWCTGASGRTAISIALNETTVRADVAEVRAAVLDARLSLSEANFGDASRALQRARVVAERLQTRLRASGEADRVGALQTVTTRLGEADRLSGALDPGASAVAAEALRALEASVPVSGP